MENQETFTFQVKVNVEMTPKSLMSDVYGNVENERFAVHKEIERQILAGLEELYPEFCADWKAHHEARVVLFRQDPSSEAAKATLRRIDARWGLTGAERLISLAEETVERERRESQI